MRGHELLLSIAPRWEPHNISPVYYGQPPRPALNSLPSDALLWGLHRQHIQPVFPSTDPIAESPADFKEAWIEEDAGASHAAGICMSPCC